MYKMKYFLARLWVSFHYEGFPHANFWDPEESLRRDVPKATSHGEGHPGRRVWACLSREAHGAVERGGGGGRPPASGPGRALPSWGSSKEYLIYKACSTTVSQYQLQLQMKLMTILIMP